MNNLEDLEALEQDIEEITNNNEYGLVKLKDIVIDLRELEQLTSNIKTLKQGYNLSMYNKTLTDNQKDILEAYNIDFLKGKELVSLEDIKAERNNNYEDKNN